MSVREIDVERLHALRESGASHLLLDVREADEVRTAQVAGATHIPMGEVATRLVELPKDRDIVVMCHHGGRSERVTQYLNDHGFPRAVNLTGGIDAWSRTIDPLVPLY